MRRAQFALEFMMTYGWAILSAIAVIGVLAYLGVGSNNNSSPEKCIFPAGFSCVGKQVTLTDTKILIRNANGQTIYNLRANLSDNSVVCNCTPSPARDDSLFNITCNTGIKNWSRVARFKINLYYNKVQNGFDQLAVGEINANINP